MIRIKPRRILAVLGLIVFLVGGYMGWQIYQGQQMANQYTAEVQKQAQGSGDSSASADQTSPSQSALPQNSSTQAPQSPGSQPNSPNAGDYKQLMSSTYQQTLQTMQNVKGNTLAFQGRNLSLAVYKNSILQAQTSFNTAEAFVRAHPPTEEKLNASYREFLAGISLAKESMGVVLNGISSLNASNFYAALEMGKTAQQQLINGYSRF